MSRTKHAHWQNKGEYWSRRPYSGRTPSPHNKHMTHKAERQQGREQINDPSVTGGFVDEAIYINHKNWAF